MKTVCIQHQFYISGNSQVFGQKWKQEPLKAQTGCGNGFSSNFTGDFEGRRGDSIVGKEQEYEKMGKDIGYENSLTLSGCSLLLLMIDAYVQDFPPKIIISHD